MLTVVIPSYNHEKYIADCLAAACAINVKGLRVLVIDDGSTDNTVNVVEDFISQSDDHHIKIVKKKNSGLVSSLNLALELVDTEYVYICASDDIPVPGGIEKSFAYMVADKSINFFIGGAINFDDLTGVESSAYGDAHRIFFETDFSKNENILFLNYPSPLLLQSVIFRKSALDDVGGWDSTLKLDDYPMFIKLLKSSSTKNHRSYKFLPRITVVRYRHHGSNTYANLSNQFFMVKQAMEKLAPDSIKNKAVGIKAAYYILSAVKRIQFLTIVDIFRQCDTKLRFMLPYYLFLVVLGWYERR